MIRKMNTVEEYKIIQSDNLGSLAKEVNAALKEGWQPHGAPFVHGSGAAVVCCQAMVNFINQRDWDNRRFAARLQSLSPPRGAH
jgi:hypothetical protein